MPVLGWPAGSYGNGIERNGRAGGAAQIELERIVAQHFETGRRSSLSNRYSVPASAFSKRLAAIRIVSSNFGVSRSLDSAMPIRLSCSRHCHKSLGMGRIHG